MLGIFHFLRSLILALYASRGGNYILEGKLFITKVRHQNLIENFTLYQSHQIFILVLPVN